MMYVIIENNIKENDRFLVVIEPCDVSRLHRLHRLHRHTVINWYQRKKIYMYCVLIIELSVTSNLFGLTDLLVFYFFVQIIS